MAIAASAVALQFLCLTIQVAAEDLVVADLVDTNQVH